MELQYYGANCLRLSTKKAEIVVDDNLEKLGLKTVTRPSDISLRTSGQIPSHSSAFTVDMPGEYEVSGVVIQGIASRAHMDKEDEQNAVIYTVKSGDIKVALVGHVFPKLSEEQLDKIGLVDVAVVPVGNSGYTMDGKGAAELIKQLEPRIVIPSHYADKAVKYEVPQVELAESLKAMGMEAVEPVAKYKPNPADLTDTTHLVIMQRQ